MDIFAHFLWTFAFYWKHPRRLLAGLIGTVPDLFAFAPHFLLSIGTGVFRRGIPSYVYMLYNISHSLVVCALGMVLLYYFARRWFWISFGWPLHILIDMFTHSKQFFPTPFLWPLSDFRIDGLPWSTGWFMLLNYSILAMLYFLLPRLFPPKILLRKQRRKAR